MFRVGTFLAVSCLAIGLSVNSSNFCCEAVKFVLNCGALESVLHAI